MTSSTFVVMKTENGESKPIAVGKSAVGCREYLCELQDIYKRDGFQAVLEPADGLQFTKLTVWKHHPDDTSPQKPKVYTFHQTPVIGLGW